MTVIRNTTTTMRRMTRPQMLVVPSPTGGWDVEWYDEGQRVIAPKNFSLQREAIVYAEGIAKKQKSELVVYGSSGNLINRQNYGRKGDAIDQEAD